MAATQAQPSHTPRNWRLIITVAVIVVVAIIAVLVLANINSIVDGINTVLAWIFSPNKRVDPANIIVCRTNTGCSITHAVIYSALFLFVVITGFAYTTLLERKFIAWFQSRVGPNRVGPMGLLQPAADGLKLAFKEDIMPAGASTAIYLLAPIIKIVPVLVVMAVIPLGPDILVPWFDGKWYQVPLVLADVNVGVMWLLAITSIGTYGIVLAGWASNNKYAMLGGLRASAQMISYELSLGITMAVPVMIVGSMNLHDIVAMQPMIWNWFFLQNPLAAGILMIALLAEVSRSPFDLPEAEQELTAGFMTEYSGMKFAAFMMAEYLGMIAISLMAVSLFFGGYQDGFGLVNSVPILGPLVIIGKVVLCLIGMVWIRATLPRIRYDRLMHLGWKVMLPLALVAVTWTAIAVTIGEATNDVVVYGIAAAIFFAVVLGGAYLFIGAAGRAPSDEEAEESLANDPIITGERKGIGYGILNVIGGLLSALFGLYQFTLTRLDALAALGDKKDEPGSALAVKDETSKSPANPAGD